MMEEQHPREPSTTAQSQHSPDGGSPASTNRTASPVTRAVDDPITEAVYNVEEREALLTSCMWRQLHATHYALCDAMSQHHYSSIAFVFGEAAAGVIVNAGRSVKAAPLNGSRVGVAATSVAAARRATSAQQPPVRGVRSASQQGLGGVRSTSRTSAPGRSSVNGDTASHVSNRSASGSSYRHSSTAAAPPTRGTAPPMRRTSPMPRGPSVGLTTQRLNGGGSVGGSTVGTRRTSIHDGSPLATRSLRSVDHQSDVVTLPLGFRSVTPTRKAHLVPAPAPSVKMLFEERRRCDERKDVLTRSSDSLLPPDGEAESSDHVAARPRSAPRKLSVLHADPTNHQRTIAAQRSPVARRTSPVRTAATANQVPHASAPSPSADVAAADGVSTTSVHDSAATSEQRRVSPYKATSGVASRGPVKSPVRSRLPPTVSPMKRPVTAGGGQRVSPRLRSSLLVSTTAVVKTSASSGAPLSARSGGVGSALASARSIGSSTAPSTSRASPLQRMSTKERSSSTQSLTNAAPSLSVGLSSLADPRRSTSATRREEGDALVPGIAVTACDSDSRPQTARSESAQASRSGSVLSSGKARRPSPRNSNKLPAHRRSSRMSTGSSCSAQERQVIDYALEVLKCGVNRTLEVDVVPQPLMTPLQPNDLLLEVDGKSMSTLDQLRAHFELMYRPRATVPLTTSVSILRGTEYLIIDVPLPRVIIGQTTSALRNEDVPDVREALMDGVADVDA